MKTYDTNEYRKVSMTRSAAAMGLLAAIAILSCTCPSLRAGDWAERAGKMNRKEISPGEAAQKSNREDEDRRNKLSVGRIHPAQPDVDWNADPTAVPYMMYQINKRTDLPVFINNAGLNVSKDDLF